MNTKAFICQVKAAQFLMDAELQSHDDAIKRCLNLGALKKVFKSEKTTPSENKIVSTALKIIDSLKPPCLFFHPWLTKRSSLVALKGESKGTVYQPYFDQILLLLDNDSKLPPIDAVKRVITATSLKKIYKTNSHWENCQMFKKTINLMQERVLKQTSNT